MILSVIIVNYNVKYFLEQCLLSVKKALDGINGDGEVIVVDNHSPDGSVEYLAPGFPWVTFIANKDNAGFSRANNQALLQAKGDFILFLNPDTILPEDCFSTCLDFFREREEAGAAGLRMVDGSGLFLKESKRGFPSPWVAFCKLGGLSALFPRSRLFAGYYLGHLSAGQDHPAPILSGACLWARREALDRTGGFDERFFMYAEDIDLSHRIEKAGYRNYYIAGATILHFKGESTRKDARYIKIFYKAMSQFRRKHFTRGFPALFNGVLEVAIWFRAGITAMVKLFRPGRNGTEKKEGQKTCHKLLLRGDPETIGRLKGKLIASGNSLLAEDPDLADGIVYCEGKTFSFKDFIDILQQKQTGPASWIHAAGSSSIVGSADREGQGEMLVL